MYEYNAYVITGGTGFIGKQIVKTLVEKNKKVYVISRQKKVSDNPLITYIQWDVEQHYFEQKIEDKNLCVIHLAGTNVSEKRWTTEQKKNILNSRTQSSQFLFELIQNKTIQASYLVSASAIGYYGEEKKVYTETDIATTDFLGTTCKAWEESVMQIKSLSIPIGILRIGLVLGKDGGAVPAFMQTLRLGIAGIPASGKQVYSWIHIEDIARLFLYMADKKMEAIYNAVAPHVTTAKELLHLLGKYYCTGKFIALPIPSFILKIALGEFSVEILKTCRVSGQKIIDSGFVFKYSTIDKAVEQIVQEISGAKK